MIGGGEWESNPTGTVQSPTLDLKSRRPTRRLFTPIEDVAYASTHGLAPQPGNSPPSRHPERRSQRGDDRSRRISGTEMADGVIERHEILRLRPTHFVVPAFAQDDNMVLIG